MLFAEAKSSLSSANASSGAGLRWQKTDLVLPL